MATAERDIRAGIADGYRRFAQFGTAGRSPVLLRSAIEIARAYPPRLVLGDLRRDLKPLAAEAPADATLVVYHTAVLAYVPDPEERAAFARSVAEVGAVWLANEGIENMPDAPTNPFGKAPRYDAFLLCVNGEPIAWTDSHGTWIDWRGN